MTGYLYPGTESKIVVIEDKVFPGAYRKRITRESITINTAENVGQA